MGARNFCAGDGLTVYPSRGIHHGVNRRQSGIFSTCRNGCRFACCVVPKITRSSAPMRPESPHMSRALSSLSLVGSGTGEAAVEQPTFASGPGVHVVKITTRYGTRAELHSVCSCGARIGPGHHVEEPSLMGTALRAMQKLHDRMRSACEAGEPVAQGCLKEKERREGVKNTRVVGATDSPQAARYDGKRDRVVGSIASRRGSSGALTVGPTA